MGTVQQQLVRRKNMFDYKHEKKVVYSNQKVFNSQDKALKFLKENRFRSYESFTHKKELYRIYRGSFGKRAIFRTENRVFYDNVATVSKHRQTKYIVEVM
tara:strand:- start:252 stop:551 length:300 start_codon:yes stop_codon:yes gene_type:complete